MPRRSFRFSSRQKQLLRQELRQKGQGSDYQRIPPRPVADERPLSFGQKRLWFLDQLAPGSAAYNLPAAIRLEGELDLAALRRGLREVFRRHEVLRGTFADAAGQPRQSCLPPEALRLPAVDLAALDDGRRRSEALRLAGREARRPFDLTCGPLLRIAFLRLGVREHVLLLTLHHIVSDGVSTGLALHELGILYQAFSRRGASPLPELPIQYADFAAWQRERLRGERLAAQLDYWRQRLEGAPEVLELPTDRPYPVARAWRGSRIEVRLSRQLWPRLQALARDLRATVFMLTLATFKGLLHRYTGQRDLLVGSPVTGRNRQETRALIGFFANTLVLRTNLAGDPRFADLVDRVMASVAGAYEHQEVPFERLVEELQPQRNLSSTPIYQVMFAFEETPEWGFAGLASELFELDSGTVQVDLNLTLRHRGEELTAVALYDAELFDGSTVRRWLGHFQRALGELSARPGSRLSQLEMLPAAERQQLLLDWLDTATAPQRPILLHELFEAQARRTPAAVAVASAGRWLTYRELAARAARLAHALRRHGVGPEVRVAVALERSPELVAAVLAVLKAGGAYVPLDPRYPRERIRLMLADSGARVLLARPDFPAPDPRGAATWVRIDPEDPEIDRQSSREPAGACGPRNLAYVIYTSGSTGRPKGVAIEHRSPVAFIRWALETFDGEESATVLASTSICFDLSVFELFMPLSRGGTVLLVEDALELPRMAAAGNVTMINTVPSAMGVLTNGPLPAALRTVNLAGEALPPAVADQVHERRVRRLLNLYGPSEDTTYSTCAQIEPRPRRRPQGAAFDRVPIGWPVADTRSYLVGRRLQLLPAGIPGELLLAGAGLARGYLGRPGRTAESFIPDPFARRPGERLYKTGDLVRTLPPGELDFLTRLDHQVKLRGFRIEPGEIESTLAAHPGVREAAVVVRQHTPGGDQAGRQRPTSAQLVAFWVPRRSPTAASGELRRWLESRLPEHMVPALFVPLEALPRTPNGKVDRRTLDKEALPTRAPGTTSEIPGTQEERLLAGIWAQLLGRERVGRHDHFFELGGHSLLATQVLSRVRDSFGIDLPVRAVFETPTLAALAARLRRAARGDRQLPAPPLGPVEREGPLPLSFAQQRLWLAHQLDSGAATYNIFAAARLAGRLDVVALERSLREVELRHETLRTTFPATAGEPIQVIRSRTDSVLPRVDLSALPNARQEVRRLARDEARRPFDLARGPLIRYRLLALRAEEHVLLINLDHIVADGWSMGVLLDELGALYPAFAAGEPSPLDELPLQYADFADWQHRWLRGDVLDSGLSYWRQQLSGAPPVIELPTDRPRPPVPSPRGARRSIRLPEELAAGLVELGRRQGATPFMILLAAFKVLLHRTSGQRDLVVGSPVANRDRLEIEGLIGFFVNMLVLRTDLDTVGSEAGGIASDPSFRELVTRVREIALTAYAHQHVPFEKLLEALATARDLPYTPLFQVTFALQNLPPRGAALADLELTLMDLGTDTAKFDWSLVMVEDAGGLMATLEYRSELFDPTTVARVLGHFRNLLAGIVKHPGRRLSQLLLLTPAERSQLLIEWNDTAAPEPEELWVHRLFEAQARRQPSAPAVVSGEVRLSYGELDRRAERLAERLRSMGIGPEMRVGILTERSPEAVLGPLAVLKAGAAYLPLDPAYPRRRLAFMLADSGAAALLIREELRPRVPECGVPVVAISSDEESAATGRLPAAGGGAIPASGRRLAYVIYTSGSTGRPKGVELDHRGLANLVAWHRRSYRPTPHDRATLLAGPAFDASVWELWPYLTAGASLHVPDAETRSSPAALLGWLAAESITCCFLATPLAEAVLEEEPPADLALRVVLTGGDRLHRFADHDLPFRLINHYGPTESTVVSTAGRVGLGGSATSVPPIGRPISNLRVYLADRRLRALPARVPGELCVGGVSLARGYLCRPRLTAERFVPHSWTSAPGDRLYRTGDLVRTLPDGQLDFLGRIDQQVKVRGFRIELGEIEAAIGGHPAVRESVVVLRESGTRESQLAAYWVARGSSGPASSELRRSLEEKLPGHMVPPIFVALEALPKTPNGKVDRRALSREALPAMPEAASESPDGQGEELLAGIWADLLGRERLGRHDNFFELGGHSLLATQVLSRVRDSFGVDLPLRALFETPTLASLAERLEQAARGERELAPPILPVARDEDPPLSFAQQRLWFLDRLEPGSPLYNIPTALHLAGRLDSEALARTLAVIAERHDVLRTAFEERDEGPVQRVGPPLAATLPRVDLSVLDEGRRQAESRRLGRDDGRRPFDLARGPVIRATLLALAPAEHVLLVTLHHIAADGWSVAILLRELGVLYRAFATGSAHDAGGTASLPELPVQYADFALWQRHWLDGAVLEGLLATWRKLLDGAPTVLELPTDRPRPPVRSSRGAHRSVVLSRQLTRALEALSRRRGVTLFMTLLAAFEALLARHTGARDLLVGTPIAGRNRAEIEGLIGFFVNTLVLRGDLSGDPGFGELLGRVRESALEAYAYQDLPFEQLVEELQPQRDRSRTPLVQVMLALGEAPREIPELPQLSARPLELATGTAKFDLLLVVARGDGGLTGSLEYAVDLFDRTTMDRLLGHFRTLLEAAVGEPETRLAALPLLTPGERCQLLREWNDTAAVHPPAPALHGLIEAQAARSPDAVALVYEGLSLSYREFDRRANRVAERLLSSGVRGEALVGLASERSLEMVVGLLAILKAGAAYVPLDPDYPRQRLGFMLRDSRVPVLLTQARLSASLPDPGAGVARLDVGVTGGGSPPPAATPSGWTPDRLAYAIYTSGSTGRPKGAMNSHRAIVNRLLWMQRAYRLTASDRILQKTPFSFDVSVWELFLPLLTGACLVIARPGGHRDSGYLVRRIVEEKITTLHFVPSMLQVFLEDPGVSVCRSVRRVIASGEALPYDLQQRFFARMGTELHNLYGPTEAAVDVTSWPCEPSGRRTVPIGRPIANARIHLLSRDLRPVPVGVPGELHIGGVALGRGYLLRPALTAEKFIPDPLAREPGGRLYKTADSARHLSDGAVEYLGRLDHQIKLRGFRIELGEIEAVLCAHPAVRDGVVLALGNTGEDASLVAFCVPDEEHGMPVRRLLRLEEAGEAPRRRPATDPEPAPEPAWHSPGHLVSDLRQLARDQLPEFMVPARIVLLNALPLTPNGKVDRAALSRRTLPVERGRAGGTTAPRTPTEHRLAEIWAEVLSRDGGQLGVDESFFDLGGHSLLAIRVVSRVREAFGVELAVGELFEAPTIADLATLIESARAAEPGPELPLLRRVSRQTPPPLSFAQQRLWFLDQLQPGDASYNIPAGFLVRGRLSPAAFERAFREVLQRHEVLRTSFVATAGVPHQVVERDVTLRLAEIDLRSLLGERPQTELGRLVRAEALRPFDLGRAPLLRVCLLRLSEEEQAVLVTMHHIVSDGWSVAVLGRELEVLYRLPSPGLPASLPDLPVQYADYAHWQRRWLAGEKLADALAYWKDKLAGVPPVLELPTDRPRAAVQGSRGAVWSFRVPEPLAIRLAELGRHHDATLFMTLLACWQALLHRYTGQDDVVVGSPVANRNRVELEALIGFFANTLVLRADLAGARTFLQLLARVRETALGAYDHQDLPFEKLVEELEPERDLAHTPLFQVMFALQEEGFAKLGLPGLTVTPLPGFGASAKFDLSLTLEESENALLGSLEYRTDLFEPTTIRRLEAHFQNLLQGIVDAPRRPLRELPLSGAAERAQLLVELNATRSEAPADTTIHRLFEARAARTPDAVALAAAGVAWSYRHLDCWANQLAHHLRATGIGPDDLVGLFMPRSAPAVAAFLGILKAGAACLPLDPGYPRQRLAWILEEAEVTLLLTLEELQPRLSGQPRVICLDSEWPRIARQHKAAPAEAGGPDHLAYTVYTSGSSGRPKGVMVSHRSLVNHCTAIGRRYRLGVADRVLQFASLTFDVAAEELFPSWLAGAAVVLQPAELVAPTEDFLGWVERERLSVLNLPASFWHEWVAWLVASGEAVPGSLRLLIVGSEPVSPRRFATWRKLVDGRTRSLNAYGLSETTITSTVHEPQGDQPPGYASVPIGRPIANTGLYVLDRHLLPAPRGVAGELAIDGRGVARGYLHRPGLTARRFGPHPFSRRPGDRLVRTGDLARHLPAGQLVVLGRTDQQVKIRGFRVEPGEIETALAAHPAVAKAVVVVVVTEGHGTSQLRAHVVARQEPAPGGRDLRAHLAERLPAYMLPAVFVSEQSLPRTPNGKIDRRALSRRKVPAGVRGPNAAGSPVTPRTPAQDLLARIWEGLLEIDAVDLDDNFFALGGHSLLATRLLSRIRQTFSLELPLRRLFETPTLAGLAASIEAARSSGQRAQAPPIVPLPRGGERPLSFAQERLWVVDRMAGASPFYNQPAAVELDGRLDVAALVSAFQHIVHRHETLRTTFAIRHGSPIQVLHPAQVSLPVIDLEELAQPGGEQRSRRLAMAAARRPFDLERGPLLRLALLRLGAERHVLLFTLHHIAGDGWSLGLLMREVTTVYEACAEGRAATAAAILPDLPVQYADFAAWQRQWLSGEVLESHLAYWRRQLGGHPPATELPVDRPRPAIPSFRGGQRSFRLAADLKRQLEMLSRDQGVTLFMLLLSAFQTLLYRATGQEDIVVGTAVAGRTRVEVEGLIGYFINVLPLRTSLAGNPGFHELLGRVREMTLGAFAHQDVPLEKLASELRWQREAGRPLVRVAFGVQNTPDRPPKLAGHSLRYLALDYGMARLDLTLWVTEEADGLATVWTYSADLFEAETIESMHARFETLLRSVVARPLSLLNDIDILPKSEKRLKASREQRWRESKAAKLHRVKRRLVVQELGHEPKRER